MNLNDLEHIKKTDPEGMIEHINGLPEQLAAAWVLGKQLELPAWSGIRQVVVAGMGGSAIGSDLLAAYAAAGLRAGWTTWRDYGLPVWAADEETLVVCSSHSGNTEETLSAFEAARAAGCRVLCISTGGQLAAAAQKAGLPAWLFEHNFQPRAAVGYSFGLLLAMAARLGLLSEDPAGELAAAVEAMAAQRASLLPEVPDIQNSAKRMGGQLMGRWVTIFGAGLMAPVAQRWKAQINENAKAQASYEIIPEANHNTIQGLIQPEGQFNATMALFLQAAGNHPRNERRAELTRMATMLQGLNTDTIHGSGEGRLAQMWTALHYGDYVSFYLAMAYGIDPTPVPMLAELKSQMSQG